MASSKSNNRKEEEQRPQKSQQIILKHAQELALTQLERSSVGLTLSGISAGLDIGFSVLLMAVTITLFQGVFPEPVVHFLVSNMYPIGFLFVILGRSELFTEHTALAVLPIMQKLASIGKLFRLWILVYLSNIFGGFIFAFILSYLADSMHFVHGSALTSISESLINPSWKTLMLGATMAGWMMGLLAWLVTASRETISQIAVIWFVTAAIGFAGLPHCIVGNIEIAVNLFRGELSFVQYLSVMGPVTFGNAFGGVLFVGVLKFSHTAFSGEEKELEPGVAGNEQKLQ